MRITVGVTDNAWADFLRKRRELTEINFWVPSGRSWVGGATPGDPFLFKTKSPTNRLVGGAFFEGFHELRVSEAWTIFGAGNGCASEAELEHSIQRYLVATGRPAHPDPQIGCVVLRNPYFAQAGEEWPAPEHWAGSIVRGKTYRDDDPDVEYLTHAFTALKAEVRLDPVWDHDLVLDQKYGEPALTRTRLGQGGFRLSVLAAYGNRCAVSGSRTLPALEAAHIQGYALGGEHLVTNGMALRADLHRLFDRGYLGVDQDLRVRVSDRLRRDFGNGADLYELQERGETIRAPERVGDQPDRGALQWHMENVFLTAS